MNNVGPEVPILPADERKGLKYDLQISHDATDVLEALAVVHFNVGTGLKERNNC